jgi:integrase
LHRIARSVGGLHHREMQRKSQVPAHSTTCLGSSGVLFYFCTGPVIRVAVQRRAVQQSSAGDWIITRADRRCFWVDPKSGRSITPHGLRATFRTWGENAGFPRDLLEESLAIRLEMQLNGLADELTASIGVEQLWRLGPISAVAGLLAAGVSARHQGSNASHDDAPLRQN